MTPPRPTDPERFRTILAAREARASGGPGDWRGMTPRPTYEVSTWDHRAGRWWCEGIGLSIWGMKRLYRALLGQGYCSLSILVTRETPP